MDNGSEAETAASAMNSDGAATLDSDPYKDPNSTYPHPLSLHSPRGIAEKNDYDFNDNNDFAVRYVSALAAELRVMTVPGAKVMQAYVTENYEMIVEFVRQYRLYDDGIYKPSKGSGSGRTTRVLVLEHHPRHGGGGDFSPVPKVPLSRT